jgi:hypothetical protein
MRASVCLVALREGDWGIWMCATPMYGCSARGVKVMAAHCGRVLLFYVLHVRLCCLPFQRGSSCEMGGLVCMCPACCYPPPTPVIFNTTGCMCVPLVSYASFGRRFPTVASAPSFPLPLEPCR